jgi:DUF1009 family protein
MEGTDDAILRAGDLMRTLHADDDPQDPGTTLARRLTAIKVAKPHQDLRFDVPVVGLPTIETMRRAGATCLCIEAGRTLLFDREAMIAAADAAQIAIVAEEIPAA